MDAATGTLSQATQTVERQGAPVSPAADAAGSPGGVWSRIAALPALRPMLWIGIPAAASAALAVVLITPAGSSVPEKDVATAWNESIGRLGVWPVYPPEEDIYVGDLWAVLTSDDPDNKDNSSGVLARWPILTTAVRIGHIDLSELVVKDEARRVLFRTDEAGTKAAGASQGGPALSTPTGIQPSLVAFPGVAISHQRNAGTSFGSRWLGWRASSEGTFTDEIHLTDTSTYGVQFTDASDEMGKWCLENSGVCTDKYARVILTQAGIKMSTDTVPNGSVFKNPIELRLITRVFLAKTIVQKRLALGEQGLAARTASEGGGMGSSAQQPPLLLPGDKVPAAADHGQTGDAAAEPARDGAAGGFARSDRSSIEMEKTYDRPIVFGYRSASIFLIPSVPEEAK